MGTSQAAEQLGGDDGPLVTCPGCGLSLPPSGGTPPAGFNASAECFERYGELSSYTQSLGDIGFSHQYAVDAYAAQHSGRTSRPITTFFALVGLYLACERGFTGRNVQRAHQALGRRKRSWPAFAPPASPGSVTVAEVLAAAPGSLRDAALRAWARSVWVVWRSEHATVRSLVEEWLPDWA